MIIAIIVTRIVFYYKAQKAKKLTAIKIAA